MPPKILIVNVNWLGDVLFSTPAIRAIRKKYPNSHIACLVPPRCEAILKNNPHLSEVIVWDDNTMAFNFFGSLRLALHLKAKRFDVAFFFHRSKTKTFLAWLAGIRERKGYQRHSGQNFLTETVPALSKKMHKIDTFLHLVENLGVPSDGRVMDFYPKTSSEKLTSILLAEGVDRNERYVILHAGGNWDLKRWPVSHFVEWIRIFKRRFPHKIILCGAASEESLSREIISNFPGKEVVSLCGKTSLDELAVLLQGASFLISNDSGPIHLAASQRTPIIGLYGPTSPFETGPVSEGPVMLLKKDVGCEVPCYFRACNHRVCMELLTPEEVLEASAAFADKKNVT